MAMPAGAAGTSLPPGLPGTARGPGIPPRRPQWPGRRHHPDRRHPKARRPGRARPGSHHLPSPRIWDREIRCRPRMSVQRMPGHAGDPRHGAFGPGGHHDHLHTSLTDCNKLSVTTSLQFAHIADSVLLFAEGFRMAGRRRTTLMSGANRAVQQERTHTERQGSPGKRRKGGSHDVRFTCSAGAPGGLASPSTWRRMLETAGSAVPAGYFEAGWLSCADVLLSRTRPCRRRSCGMNCASG